MKAQEAKNITEAMIVLNKLLEQTSSLPRTLEIIWKNIAWSMKDGKFECVMPYLPANVKVALKANDFSIKQSRKLGAISYTISWKEIIQNENTDKSGRRKSNDK